MKVKLLIISSVAKPGSMGAVLGQRGINSSEFCKRFNQCVGNGLRENFKMPVQLDIAEDGDYEFTIGHPQTTSLLALSAKLFCRQTVYEIANLCVIYDKSKNLQELCKQIIGTARSMGMIL